MLLLTQIRQGGWFEYSCGPETLFSGLLICEKRDRREVSYHYQGPPKIISRSIIHWPCTPNIHFKWKIRKIVTSDGLFYTLSIKNFERTVSKCKSKKDHQVNKKYLYTQCLCWIRAKTKNNWLVLCRIFSKLTKKKYGANITMFEHIGNTWRLDLQDKIDFGIRKIRENRYVSVVIDFSKFGWGIFEIENFKL